MILAEHVPHHDRMKKYCRAPMLMLGNQENNIRYSFGVDYRTLDPDGGDLSFDLNESIPSEWVGKCATVYNLGTLEHIWDVNKAFKNAAKIVKVGGHFLYHGPCAGYENHGVHVTDWKMVLKFFTLNGFNVVEYWFSDQFGRPCEDPQRGSGMSVILWLVAKKVVKAENFTCPQQVFKNGVKV